MIAMTNNEYLKEFVPNPLSFRMKALGFDEPCFGCYVEDNNDVMFCHKPKNSNDLNYVRTWRSSPNDDVCSAPTFSQAFKWFREKFELTWEHSFDDSQIQLYVGEIAYPDNCLDFFISIEVEYNGYNKAFEEAELACLERLLEIIESK